MFNSTNPEYLLLIFSLSLGLYFFYTAHRRSSNDVLFDLDQDSEEFAQDPREDEKLELNSDNHKDLKYKKELSLMGLSDIKSVKKFELKVKIIPIIFVAIVLIIRIIFGFKSLPGLFLATLFSFAIGVFFTSILKKRLKEDYKYKLNFYLPLVMERLVMAVQAGQDILPAIGKILEIESKKLALDPVCNLLSRVKKMSDNGLSFDKSLKIVAESVDSGALRHAFLHLGLAYKEGGELVMPLRELSDSTQLFYQETVEEEIAKMPVKATMPLLLTFAGLIIFFVTTPMLQILDVMKNTMPK